MKALGSLWGFSDFVVWVLAFVEQTLPMRLSLRAGGVLATIFTGSVGLVEVSSVPSQPPAVLSLVVANFVFSFWWRETRGVDKALSGV